MSASLSRENLVERIDYPLLQPIASRADIERACVQAIERRLHGICVYGSHLEVAYARLEETDLKLTCLVGFPFGATDSDVKRYETEAAIDRGAQEIEMVINLGRLKEGDGKFVLREMRDVAEAADERPVHLVLETSRLTPQEVALACELALDSGARFVCTGTGLGSIPSAAEVKALRALVGEKFGIKASGIISTVEAAADLINAGATRLGILNATDLFAGPTALTPSGK